MAANFSDYQAPAERDARNIERLADELSTRGVIRVPHLDEDVHDLAGLAEINRYLFATGEERVALAAGGFDQNLRLLHPKHPTAR